MTKVFRLLSEQHWRHRRFQAMAAKPSTASSRVALYIGFANEAPYAYRTRSGEIEGVVQDAVERCSRRSALPSSTASS